MLKKILCYALLFTTTSYHYHLAASENNRTQTSSESIVTKDSKKSLWDVPTEILAKGFALFQPAYAVYAAASATVLFTAYGGYQLWRKFILDSQLRDMKKELETKIDHSNQDINKHVTHHIQTSEHKQMKHTTDEIKILKTDLTQQIHQTETHIMQHADNASRATDAAIQSLHAKHDALRKQISDNHQEIITRLDGQPQSIRLPYFPSSFTQAKLINTTSATQK